jgi:hypothetical protein
MTDDEKKYDVATLDEVTKILAKFVRGQSKVSRTLAVSFLLDIVLTAGLWYVNAHDHAITQQENLATCVSGNKVRTDETHLWTYVFEKIEPAHPTPTQAKAFAEFEVQLHQDLKLRDCTVYQ